jgi:hypothetical protein
MAGSGPVRRAFAAAIGALLLGAGCGSSKSAPAEQASAPATVTSARATSTPGLATGAQRRALAARYLAIARAGNRGLNHSLDPLESRDRSRLGPATVDLRYAANVEHTFDRRLLRIPFPSETERVARKLYRVNQARASLTEAASRSTSLRELHAYDRRLDNANKPVEAAVRTIRRQLGLPPPPGS